jgi:MFS family permease
MKQEIRLNVNEAPAVNPPLATPISIGLLGAAAFVVTADVRVINPLLHIIATEFKTDVGSAGIIVTAYAIPYGLFQLVYGPIGDRYGKLKIMSIALLLFSFGTALCVSWFTALFNRGGRRRDNSNVPGIYRGQLFIQGTAGSHRQVPGSPGNGPDTEYQPGWYCGRFS